MSSSFSNLVADIINNKYPDMVQMDTDNKPVRDNIDKVVNASKNADSALASKEKAAKWAEEGEDVEVESGKYSAKHWAKKAEASADQGTYEDFEDAFIAAEA
jgi:hypothetical protein